MSDELRELNLFDSLRSFFSLFLSEWGLLLLSFLDSSLFFFTPLANDLVVIILTARNQDLFWLYPLLATAGSLGGIGFTYWIGRKIGEPRLSRFASTRKVEEAKERINRKGAFAAGAFAIVPPPFPLTPLVLASGALEVNWTRFMATAGVMRLLRFSAESLLARRYGSQIAGWLESSVFEWVVGIFIAVAIGGSAYTVYRLARRPKKRGGDPLTSEGSVPSSS